MSGNRIPICILLVLFWIGIPELQGGTALDPNTAAQTFLLYRREGSMWSPNFLQLTIRQDGSLRAEFKRRSSIRNDGEISLQLSPEEFEAIKTILLAVDIFSFRPSQRLAYTDVGIRYLEVSCEGKYLKTYYDPVSSEDQPSWEVTDMLRQLGQECMLIYDLRQGLGANEVNSIIDNSFFRSFLLTRFAAASLKECIHRLSERQSMLMALKALSRITTPVEWMGFVAREIDSADEKRNTLLIEILSSPQMNLSRSHCYVLALVFFRQIRKEKLQWSDLSKERQYALQSTIRYLDKIGYKKEYLKQIQDDYLKK